MSKITKILVLCFLVSCGDHLNKSNSDDNAKRNAATSATQTTSVANVSGFSHANNNEDNDANGEAVASASAGENLAEGNNLREVDSISGTYVGYLEHAKIANDQLAKLDLIYSRNQENRMVLSGLLKLYLGDFDSTEYVSYYFDHVEYNLLTGEFVFDNPGQDVTIRSSQLNSGEFQADFQTTTSGFTGKLKLAKSSKVVTSRPVLQPVSGEYSGHCGDKLTNLQLHAFRRNDESATIGNPLGEYAITGRAGQKNNILCPFVTERMCVINQIEEGSYNFFEKHLTLSGRQDFYECEVENGQLNCGQCNFQRSGNLVSKKEFHFVAHENNFPKTNQVALAQPLEGEYSGYLHHENSGKYQALDINMLTFRKSSEGSSLWLSSAVKLYFGEKSAKRYLTYKFPSVQYNLLAKRMILAADGQDSPVILAIEKIENGTIKGVWYSKSFGRVGEFYLTKNSAEYVDDPKPLLPMPLGLFENDVMEWSINARLGAFGTSTTNPFRPLEFAGYAYYKGGISSRLQITDGSYDFYTNSLYLQINDDRTAIGYVATDGVPNLLLSSNGVATLMPLWGGIRYTAVLDR